MVGDRPFPLPTRDGEIASQSRMRIVVAVDFGTTFTSVAYANILNPAVQKLLTSWGNGGDMTEEKVPTVLRYDNDGTTGAYVWGFRAQQHVERGNRIHEWFKLGLCNDFEERRARESELIRKYKSQTALPAVKGDECMNLVVNYLSSIKGAVDQFFSTHHDEDVAQCPRDYIITVPALWDHAEQEKTRLCAERADMGEGSQLQIIPEPEAACIYAIQEMIWMNEGDTFVICDAGGGTVDLASYTIESLKRDPIHCKLAGAATGSGGLCGSNFLNRIFQAYLEKKLKEYHGWNPDFMIEASRVFEDKIKPNFTGESRDEHIIRIQGLAESRRHGVFRNFLTLTTEELRKYVFDEVISKVEGLVRDQINNTRGPVTAVLLAGGFGKNPYLKKRLEQIDAVVRKKIKVQLIDNSDTAIARGALVAGLVGLGRTREPDDDGGFNVISARTEVVSRLAGRHYGTSAYYDFEEGTDPQSRRQHRKVRDDGDKIEKIKWFAKMGESIPDGEPISFNFCKMAKVQRGIPAHEACAPIVHIYTCEKRIPSTYKDDASVWEIAEFKIDLEGLFIPTIWKDGKEFYEAKFDIEMTLHAASLSFCGVYGKGTPEARRFPATNVVFR
ncbi:putative Hsp70 family chaperone [Karstenula rhodostoma CBS 690.94]|uniref:Hsp70 family chaperone n=1 Tax=Karstenula rhodostoma CBS 690.94 TaxID=1392251 RepID=A0A9P4PK48_9PLEO|nr:putative Hsp70 family chaperone [Karstenula rhodostoma CBS 690.94]